MSEHKSVANFPLLGKIGVMRFLGSFKIAKEVTLSFVSDHGHIFGTALANSHDARFAVRPDASSVANILLVGNGAQVAEPVVIPDAVNVVNKTFGKLPRLVKPSKPMGLVRFAIDVDVDIARYILVPRNVSFKGTASALQPRKNARFGIVMQKLFQAFLRQCIMHLSHVIAPFQRFVGKGIGASDKCAFPRLNIMEVV